MRQTSQRAWCWLHARPSQDQGAAVWEPVSIFVGCRLLLSAANRVAAASVISVCVLLGAFLFALPTPAHSQVPADPYNYSRTSSYTYDAVGRVLTETTEPNSAAWCVVSTHTYDAYGNRVTTTQANCAGAVPTRQQFASRTSSLNYAPTTMPSVVIGGTTITLPAGLFPLLATNALGQSEHKVFDPRFGQIVKLTGPNGLITTWTIDDFGRPRRETRPDGTSTITRYCYLPGRVTDITSNSAGCDANIPADAPADAVSYVHSEPRDTSDVQMGPYVRVYSDRRGRELRSVTQSFDGVNQAPAVVGQLIAKDTIYSEVGVKVIETQPFFITSRSSTTSGADDHGVTRTVVDALGRPTAIYSADPRGLAGSQAFGAYGNRVAAKTLFAYSGLTTTTTNDKGQSRTEEKNAAGLVVRITDPAGGQLVHQHDAFGNLVATKDPLQNSITVQFDIRGRRMQLSDPDAGLIKYDYNALGEVVWSETANQRAASPSSTATTMAYDELGRLVSRAEPEGTGTWSYDKYADNSACTMGVGKLCESRYVRAGTTDTRATKHYFDSLGREVSDVATVTTNGAASGPTMATARSYDASTGRLATKTYPTGLQVGYAYTARGQAYQLNLLTQATVNPLPATAGGTPGASTTLAANTVLWQAKVVNAWGRIEEQSYSNGVASRLALEAPTGRITALTAGPDSSNTTIHHTYTWDSLNNLTYRADNIGDAVAGAVTETFEYSDSLSRLTKYTVAAPAVPTGSRAVTLEYNGLGMLLNKSDVGVYTYGPSGAGAVRPHALLSMAPSVAGGGGATINYSYDANGNLITATGGKYRAIAYTSFNLPDSQSGIGGETAASGASSRYTWAYDENRQRVKEVRTITGGTQAGTRTTWYLHPDNAGNLGFEQEVNAPTSPTAANPAGTHNRHYLSFGGRAVGVLISEGTLPAAQNNAPAIITSITLKKVEYWHKDHLGSLIATTDHAGATTARYAYDPFGKRRYTNGSYDPFGTVTVDWSQGTNAGTDRGYTEHEHLDDVGIIHMNGRLFDPMLGRFLQADPHITNPSDLQNYNRYAYCLNNPLTCTDPTGLDLEALPRCFDFCEQQFEVTPTWEELGGKGDSVPSDSRVITRDDGTQVVEITPKPEVAIPGAIPNGASTATAPPAVESGFQLPSWMARFWNGLQAWGPYGGAASMAGVVVVRSVQGAGAVTSAARAADLAAEAAKGIQAGSFNLAFWAKYPSWAPKPDGALRVLSGAEYDAARSAANSANAALRRGDAEAYAGKQIHEILPVKFGGSSTDPANKIALTPAQHAELTNFWNQLLRDLK